MSKLTDFFPDQLVVSPIFGERWRKRKVLEPFSFYPSPKAVVITVPAGFITDYASIPRFLWSWLPAWGPYGPAAVVHDYLYYLGDTAVVPDPRTPEIPTKCNRKVADQIFERGMSAVGVNWFKRKIIYSAVRVFGGPHYNKKLKGA